MGEAFITRRGGGGGSAGLNFEVIGGTTQPKNPKENTIWVNADQAITRWDISAEHPYLASNTKNFICYPFYDPAVTTNGMAYTDNGDGTVKANGVAISDATFRLSFIGAADHATYLPAGKYFLSGCPAGGSGSGYRVEAKSVTTGETLALDYGAGAAFELAYPEVVRCNIVVANGATVSNLTFKPQLEKGSAATSFVKGDATGQAWIKNGTSSPAEFNALTKNGVQVYPLTTKQYIGGAWVGKVAKMYQNGAWVEFSTDFDGVLFDNGDQKTDITGGWANVTSGAMITASNSSASGISSLRYTKNMIDLTDYSTIKANLTACSGKANLIVTKTIEELFSAFTAYKQVTTTGEMTLDVSTLEGEYYVAMAAGVGSANFTANKVWLE